VGTGTWAGRRASRASPATPWGRRAAGSVGWAGRGANWWAERR
jgi:hypothetical protein